MHTRHSSSVLDHHKSGMYIFCLHTDHILGYIQKQCELHLQQLHDVVIFRLF